ncbi:coiled-coil domain-containing protein 162 isoform X2 [Callorhinchus milii]|uniref:coiled-coil domain-containing protein 162 isoform X2 n=1 Tax=Callorhinchus milii TaxID=7868 RepID=UPI001C3F9464|nr:coiled-coil domain-containing protein 162 isoform X2 [Callorhinchus milii]
MFFQFDVSVRHSIREAFLTSGRVAAFQAVTDGMYHGLPAMSNAVCSSIYGLLLPLPQPLNPHSDRANALFPWRTFLAREGLFPVMISSLHNIESNMQMCLCGLSDLERSIANGELLGVSLLIEELVQSGRGPSTSIEKDQSLCEQPVSDNEQKESATAEEEGRKQSPVSSTMPSPKTLPKSGDLISAYTACKSFLVLWKQLEVFKEEWGRLKLGVDNINSMDLYKQFCRMYRVEIVYPTMKAIGRRFDVEDEYERLLMDNQPLLPPKGASEVEIKTLQLHKILESMECHMIYELQKKVAKEMTLVMSERAREDATLPTDLWKRSVMKECFSVARPQIVENFVQKLMEHSQESHKEIIFNKDHLRDCLTNLEGEVMARERSNFETYSMCYENILRQEHQLLYQKEQETKRMQHSSTPSGGADCQLADLSHEMIIEITALRAKLTSLEEESARLKKEIRKEMNQEYDALVRHLFASCFALKVNLDKYHINMNKTVYELIGDVRREAVENIITLKKKVGSTKEDDTLKGNLARQEQLQCLRDENSRLEQLVCKLKIINCWRQTVKQEQFQRSRSALEQEVIKTKKDYLNIKMFAEEEVILLRQQLEAVRKALAKSQAECQRVKEELEKEKWLLKEYQHRTSQDLRSRQQLDNMKASDMERLLEDMTEKEQQLRLFTDHFERSSKIDQIQHSKTNKEIKQIRSQLSHERNLKLDAFQRLDELQSQVYDFEAILPQKSCASGTQSSTNTSPLISRNYYQTPLTAGPKTNHASGLSSRLEGRMQRPKTVPYRLRSKAVELPVPDHEEQIPQRLLLQLLELRMNRK